MKQTLRFPVIILGIVFFLIPATALWSVTHAEPLPPAKAVNHQTHQCAEILNPGDECGNTLLPPDWEYLEAGATCPDDYTFVDISANLGRAGFKDFRCCNEVSLYGTHGDCQDVMIQQVKRQCAFKGKFQNCAGLPDGWKAWGKYCPDGYKWVNEVACTSEGDPQAAHTPLVPCLSAGLILAFLLGVRFSRP